MEQQKTGLVAEGGGMKCAYNAGVLDAFLEEGISFDYCIGVSAGAGLVVASTVELGEGSAVTGVEFPCSSSAPHTTHSTPSTAMRMAKPRFFMGGSRISAGPGHGG